MRIEYIVQARMPTEKAHGLQIAHMCNAFTALGHEVTLTVPKRGNPIKESLFSYYGIQESFPVRYLWAPDIVTRFGKYGFWAHWLHSWLFVIRLLSYAPAKDTLIYTRSGEIAWLYSLRGYKVVCEVHDWPESFQSLFTRFLRRVDLLPCNSPGTARVCNEYGLMQTVVAHNGISPEDFMGPFDTRAIRAQLGLPADKNIVMYIGALQKWKGVEVLCEAAKFLSEDTLVAVIGGTEKEVAALATRYPNVRFLGSRPYAALAANQSVADVLVVPNIPENKESTDYTSPIKLFAHMASGVPIVISDLPSLRAIVDDSMASFFIPGNAEGLARAINKQFSSREEARMHAENAKKRSADYAWTVRAKKILDALAIKKAVSPAV